VLRLLRGHEDIVLPLIAYFAGWCGAAALERAGNNPDLGLIGLISSQGDEPPPTGTPKPEELELELIQSHMAQKPVLRGEVGCACVARKLAAEYFQKLAARRSAPKRAATHRNALQPALTRWAGRLGGTYMFR